MKVRGWNRVLSTARAPVEQGMARLKSRQVFRRSRISLNCVSHANVRSAARPSDGTVKPLVSSLRLTT